MKIMFLAGSYWPSQDGVSQVTQYLAEGLARRHEVQVIATRKDLCGEEEHEQVKIKRVKAKRSQYLCCILGDKKKARESIVAFQPDVLIIVGIQNWGYDWFKGELDRLPGKKMLMTHGSSCLRQYDVWNKIKKLRLRKQIITDLMEVNFERYWKKYQKTLPVDMKKFDLVSYLYEGEDLYKHMQPYNLGNGMVLENATEDIFFERKAYLIDNNKEIVFINVSNYEMRKNQKMILKVYGKLNLSNTRLILIGSRQNEYYNELLEMKEQIEKDKNFRGQINIYAGLSRDRVLELYKDADVYVSASSWEAMSISLCEAAAGGLLILSTDVGHVSQIPGVRLFHIEEELKCLMSEACENPDMRRECGMRANAYAEDNYRIQKKVDQLEEKLMALCRG